MSIPRDLAQARHIDLLGHALALAVNGRRSGITAADHAMGAMTRDQLIAYILRQREEWEEKLGRTAARLKRRRDRNFEQRAARFMDQNDELLRRLADGGGE